MSTVGAVNATYAKSARVERDRKHLVRRASHSNATEWRAVVGVYALRAWFSSIYGWLYEVRVCEYGDLYRATRDCIVVEGHAHTRGRARREVLRLVEMLLCKTPRGARMAVESRLRGDDVRWEFVR